MKKLLTILLTLSIISCGQTSKGGEPKSNDNWKTLSEKNYSIKYPSTWELNQSGQMGMSFVLFSPLENANDKFKENVNLLIQDLTGKNIDLNKYVEISEGQVKTLINNSTIIESRRIKNGNNEYHKLVYSGNQGVYHLKFEQYYWVINQKAYILTLTCEQNKFADFKEVGENILNSFSFNK